MNSILTSNRTSNSTSSNVRNANGNLNSASRILGPLARRVAAAVAVSALTTITLLSANPAQAQTADQVKSEFARSIYLSSATQVHNEAPQPLLRAVVVLRIKLNDQDQWQAEVFRDNADQPEMTRAALESVARLPAPVGLSPKARQMLRAEGLVEAWLFQNDGRFALKSLAKPQRAA